MTQSAVAGSGPPCPPGLSERFWRFTTTFLPNERDTLLVRAALLSGDACAAAWEAWSQSVRDPVRALGTDRRHIKALVPFIARNLRANGVDSGIAFKTYAAAAHLTEKLRMQVYFRECGRVLALLNEHDVQHVVLKGAALAESVYHDPALRHAHDLDILILNDEAPRAFDVLRARGFEPYHRGVTGNEHHHLPRLQNTIGLGVELHRRPASLFVDFDADGVGRRSAAATIAGEPTRVPSYSDSLTLAAAHAVACTSSANLRWTCDSWLLATRLTPDDWRGLPDLAAAANVSLPLAMAFGYLDHAIGPAVPAPTLAALYRDAGRVNRRTRSDVIFGTRCSMPLDLSGILNMPGGWSGRLAQLVWRLAPPPRHMHWMYGTSSPWEVVPRYPRRLLSQARRTLPTS